MSATKVMRKNGSRLISIGQYRITDLFLFAVILIAFELIIHYAAIALKGGFLFSPMVPIVLIVMMRWGWPSVFFALGDGLLYCLLNLNADNFRPELFGIHIIGNAFIMLLLIMIKFMGKDKIAGKWYFSALFVVSGWIAVVLGRSIVAACFKWNFAGVILDQLISDILTPFLAIIIILVMRRLEGMFEDQKKYLLRKEAERKEKLRRDTYGDEPVEIDEESLSILNRRDDDLY